MPESRLAYSHSALETLLNPIDLNVDEAVLDLGSCPLKPHIEDCAAAESPVLPPRLHGGDEHNARVAPVLRVQLKNSRLARLLRNKKRVVFVTGAGISTSAGSKRLPRDFSL